MLINLFLSNIFITLISMFWLVFTHYTIIQSTPPMHAYSSPVSFPPLPCHAHFYQLDFDWPLAHWRFSVFVCLFIQALKVLRTAEYAPLVVFIAAPSMSALAELRSSINVSLALLSQTHTLHQHFDTWTGLTTLPSQGIIWWAKSTSSVYIKSAGQVGQV